MIQQFVSLQWKRSVALDLVGPINRILESGSIPPWPRRIGRQGRKTKAFSEVQDVDSRFEQRSRSRGGGQCVFFSSPARGAEPGRGDDRAGFPGGRWAAGRARGASGSAATVPPAGR